MMEVVSVSHMHCVGPWFADRGDDLVWLPVVPFGKLGKDGCSGHSMASTWPGAVDVWK